MAQRTERASKRMFSAACSAAFQSVDGAAPTQQQRTSKVLYPDEAEKMIKQLQERNHKLQRDQLQYEKVISRLERDNEALSSKLKTFSSPEELQERNQKLQRNQLQYEKVISRLERDNEALSSKLKTAEQQLQTQRDQLERRECLQRLSGHIQRQAQVDQARKEAQCLLELNHKKLQEDYQTLLSEKEALLKENQWLQQGRSQILEEKEDLLFERDVLLKTKDGVDKKVRLLMADKVQADQLLLSYRAKIQTLKNQLEDSRSLMDSELKAALEAERNNNAKCSQQQAEEIQRFQTSVAGLSALLSAYQQEHQKEAAEKMDLQQQNNTLQQEKEDQAEEIHQLQATVTDLTTRLSTSQQEHRKESTEKLDLQQLNNTLQQDKEDLVEEIHQLQASVADLSALQIDLLQKQNELQKENEAMHESLTKRKTGCFSFLRRTKKPGQTLEKTQAKTESRQPLPH